MKLIDPEKFRQPLILYHSGCWDGFAAAWIAWRYFEHNIEAVPVQYGQEPPDTTQRRVFILDFSYSREILLKMNSVCRSMMLIDHHKTAVEGLTNLPFMHRLEEGKSGGRLTWEHFHGKNAKAPWLVDYTEDRDLWRHALPDSMEVNAAIRSYPLDFEQWERWNDGADARGFVCEGETIRRREKQIVEEHVRHAREVERDGHKVLVVNATVLYSEIAGELAKGRPFAATYFDREDGKRQWSLRSDDNGLDVSAIAKAHGGGGHFHAAGYEEKI